MQNIIQAVVFGVGLSMDSFAVALSTGMGTKKITEKQVYKIAFFFALFQGAMPVVGYCLSSGFMEYIKTFDHWVALILLSIIGIKMIIEAVKPEEESEFNPTSTKSIITKAIATSIDALAIGITLATLEVNIILYACMIFMTTFIFSYIGAHFGSKLNSKFSTQALLLGGTILILLGLKIFFEHMNFF